MKKSLIVIVGAMVAGIVSADLAVNWKSTAVGVQDDQSAFVVGGTVQLIWSPSGALMVAGGYNVNLSAVRGESDGVGGFVLNSNVTGDYGLFGPFSEGSLNPYTDADVGGADVNTGFFFTRIFESNAIGEQYFLDIGNVDASAWVFSATDPLTVYGENAVPGAPGELVNTGDNGTFVAVPEPATFGLMGVAALGLFLARKKVRR